MEYIIREARVGDAPAIARAVTEAVGTDHCRELAAEGVGLADVTEVFRHLAAREDTQYSFRNALVAVADDEVVGVCVAYDGARLYELREAFFEAADGVFNLRREEVPDETDASEYYLDSLWVAPAWRGRGIASALIGAMARRAEVCGKPLGLLCDPANTNAARLYAKLGFRPAGTRSFMGIGMNRLQRP